MRLAAAIIKENSIVEGLPVFLSCLRNKACGRRGRMPAGGS